jgi:hypothetical protein
MICRSELVVSVDLARGVGACIKLCRTMGKG